MSIYISMMKKAVADGDSYQMKSIIQSSVESETNLAEFNTLIAEVTDYPGFWDSSDGTVFPSLAGMSEAEIKSLLMDEGVKLPDNFSKERVQFLRSALGTLKPIKEESHQSPVHQDSSNHYSSNHYSSNHYSSTNNDSHVSSIDKKLVVVGATAVVVGLVAMGVATSPLLSTTGKVVGIAGGVTLVAGGAMYLNTRRGH